MQPMKINPAKRLRGKIDIPGDKSISHRAIMLGAIARGTTEAKGILDCDDCNCTIRAFRQMGVEIVKDRDLATIDGKGLKGFKRPERTINVGESGTSMRLVAGILAGQDFESTLEGGELLSRRPMGRIVEPLSRMGVEIESASGGYPPLRIKGGAVKPIDYDLPVPSAQIKSAVLLAGLYAGGVTTVRETFKSRDHTERMMEYFGARVKVDGLNVSVEGGHELAARRLEIPGDISSASFFIAAATILKGSRITIKKVNINPTRAGILDILARMNARVNILNRTGSFEPVADIEVESSATKGIVIGEDAIPAIIDELPVIFVLAVFSEGRTVIKGAGELRVKETDRIDSMVRGLERMGARIEVGGDEIVINGTGSLKGEMSLQSFGDHRTCMAMAIAALAAGGESVIDDTKCVSKSFPSFFEVLEKLKG